MPRPSPNKRKPTSPPKPDDLAFRTHYPPPPETLTTPTNRSPTHASS
jgi:hypothetical protein